MDHLERDAEHELHEDVEGGVEDAGVDEHVREEAPDLRGNKKMKKAVQENED